MEVKEKLNAILYEAENKMKNEIRRFKYNIETQFKQNDELCDNKKKMLKKDDIVNQKKLEELRNSMKNDLAHRHKNDTMKELELIVENSKKQLSVEQQEVETQINSLQEEFDENQSLLEKLSDGYTGYNKKSNEDKSKIVKQKESEISTKRGYEFGKLHIVVDQETAEKMIETLKKGYLVYDGIEESEVLNRDEAIHELALKEYDFENIEDKGSIGEKYIEQTSKLKTSINEITEKINIEKSKKRDIESIKQRIQREYEDNIQEVDKILEEHNIIVITKEKNII